MKASGERRRRRSSGFLKYGRCRILDRRNVDKDPGSGLDDVGVKAGGGDWRTFV